MLETREASVNNLVQYYSKNHIAEILNHGQMKG